MTTAATLAGDALGLLGITDPTDSVAAEDASLCLRTLNRVVDSLGADSLMPIATVYQTVALTAGDGSVTIGPAGDIVATRPTRIEAGAYVSTGALDQPLDKLTRDRWAAITDKAFQGVPCAYWYEPTTSVLGTINFWPVPDTTYTAYLPLQSRLSAFADLTTEYNLPDGYEEFLVAALAVYCAPYYNREAPQSVIARMKMARRLIKRLHVQIPHLSTAEISALGMNGLTASSILSGGGEFLLVE